LKKLKEELEKFVEKNPSFSNPQHRDRKNKFSSQFYKSLLDFDEDSLKLMGLTKLE